MNAREWQFDGLVGPTHNYAGLALGNMAAKNNAGSVSNPRAAALQGLEKMKFVRDLGVPQAFIPPHYRPLITELRRIGFAGDTGRVLEQAYQYAPGVLAAVFSSAYMWVANAGTVTPSQDSFDHRLHITPANLSSHYHRHNEAKFTRVLLENIFHNKNLFSIHNSLSSADGWGDEGAANHMRVNYNTLYESINIYVYGQSHFSTLKPDKFPSRQRYVASESIARMHGVKNESCLFLQQSPEAIDQGVFHNDVIAMNSGSRMIVHEQAYIPEHMHILQGRLAKLEDFRLSVVRSEDLALESAVRTYLFNSQLLELAGGNYVLIAPSECRNHAEVQCVIKGLLSSDFIREVHYLDVRESMRNGGGPACLRLRIVMTPEQERSMHQLLVLTDNMHAKLESWILRHYRDRLQLSDFRDPEFVNELDAAYAELEELIGLPGLYDDYRQQI